MKTMKTYTRKEAILEMMNGKQVTSDEFVNPDETYCVYDEMKESPFRYCNKNGIDEPIAVMWNTKTWRLRKYIPKDKKLVWCWNNGETALAVLRYFDAENACTFSYCGLRDSKHFDNYAPFDGTPPPNICSVDELKD